MAPATPSPPPEIIAPVVLDELTVVSVVFMAPPALIDFATPRPPAVVMPPVPVVVEAVVAEPAKVPAETAPVPVMGFVPIATVPTKVAPVRSAKFDVAIAESPITLALTNDGRLPAVPVLVLLTMLSTLRLFVAPATLPDMYRFWKRVPVVPRSQVATSGRMFAEAWMSVLSGVVLVDPIPITWARIPDDVLLPPMTTEPSLSATESAPTTVVQAPPVTLAS
jgi:hypothetical protein